MKYLFYVAKIYSIPIIQPLVEYLKLQNSEYAFYVSQKVFSNRPAEWDEKRIFTRLNQTKKFNPDFVLCPGNFVDFRIPGLKVQLFHGLGVEKEVHFKIRHFFDLYLTSGPFVTERFEKMRQEYKYFLIRETGWPKIDYILNYPKKEVEKLDWPENKKIILYAPTFSSKHESASALIDIIPKIMKDDEFWLFKFHELMDKEIISRFSEIIKDAGKILKNEEITPYLHAADLMISDTSSVIYEFMVLDKPIITYCTKGKTDKGINITKPEDLRTAIDKCLANPQEMSAKRKEHLSQVNPRLDGKISAGIIDMLENFDRNIYSTLKKKPFNLFRKLQLVYHGIFKKGYLK